MCTEPPLPKNDIKGPTKGENKVEGLSLLHASRQVGDLGKDTEGRHEGAESGDI